MSDLIIRPASGADAARWDTFVEAHPAGTCFHRWGWHRPLHEVLGYSLHSLVAERNGSLVGVLPLAEVRSRLFGRSLASLPFCTYGGPVATEPTVRQALDDAAAALADRLGAQHLEYRAIDPIAPQWPTQTLYVSFRRDLPANPDDLASLPQKRRNMVRKAIGLGLTAQVAHDVDRFFELYAANAHAHGTPALPRRFFDVLLDSLGSAAARILFVRDAAGHDVSAILSFFHRGEVHAGFAGEQPSARALAANDFKYWQLMRHAVASGCTRFDLGRSKRGTGSFEFKRLWGLAPQPLHYQYPVLRAGRVPANNPSNPRFALAMRAWRRLPRAVVDRLGPRLIHGLG